MPVVERHLSVGMQPCVTESLQSVLKKIIQLHTSILLVNNVLIAVRHGAFTVHLLLSPLTTKSVYCFNTTFANNKVKANQSK